jgi:NAD(P)-dependent dehydrogenase (short-subunit alcohol dehydrogenase family)
VASLAGCRRFVERFSAEHDSLDVLIHNAGSLLAGYTRTEEGYEHTYAAQVLGPHVLTDGLLPLLRRGTQPRVITVSSGGMYTQGIPEGRAEMAEHEYNGTRAYALAKRAQVVMTAEWARRLPGEVAFHCMHPGWVDTPGVRSALPRFHALTRPILRQPHEGADTVVWLSAVRSIPGPSGSFWLDRRTRGTTRLPRTRVSPRDAQALWDRVCRDSGAPPGAGPA